MDVHPDSPLPIHPMWPLTVPLFYGIHYEILLCIGFDNDGIWTTHIAFHQDT